MVFMAAERIGQAVIADIYKNIQIGAPHGLQDDSFRFTGPKTGNFGVQQVRVALIAGKCKTVFVFAFAFCSPFHQIIINFLSETAASFQRNDAQGTYGYCFQVSFFFARFHEKSSLSVLHGFEIHPDIRTVDFIHIIIACYT